MTLPALLFGLVIALLTGALYHAARGGGGGRLFLYIFLSIAGFALGQWVSMAYGWWVYPFGVLDIGVGVIGSVLVLILGDWLSRVEAEKR
jgi:uncharacterized membrane protein YeaQ/YmgE (transglycosylase-associated protein family)